MTTRHMELEVGNIHVAHQWEYADESARIAATGFVPSDVHKLALQLNDKTLWMLVDDDPITWAQMNPSDPANTNRITARVLKGTSGSIAKGKAVYMAGFDPITGYVLVEKADASNVAKMPAIGVLDSAITEAVSGLCVVIGGIENVDTSAFSFNDSLYVSPTVPGDLTVTRPVSPHLIQLKAYASVIHATSGVLGCISAQILKPSNLEAGKIWLGDTGGGIPTTTDWAHAARHKGGGADVIAGATGSLAGLMSAADKAKLDALTSVSERFFRMETASNYGTYRTRALGTGGVFNFDLFVPNDFASLVSIEAIGIPNANFTNKNIQFSSSYGAVGESYIVHAETNNVLLFSGVQNVFLAVDLSTVFTAIAAGDLCGVTITHVALGTTIDYLGIRLRYNKT